MENLKKHFSDSHFLTVRCPKGIKFQRLEQMRKHCLKISKTFFIVKENNAQNDSVHFHAIMKLFKKPAKGWFKKGVHMDLRKIGGVLPNMEYQIPDSFTGRDFEDMLTVAGDILPEEEAKIQEDIASILEQQILKRHIRRKRKRSHLGRTLTYIFKQLDAPRQYENYIFIKNGKSELIN